MWRVRPSNPRFAEETDGLLSLRINELRPMLTGDPMTGDPRPTHLPDDYAHYRVTIPNTATHAQRIKRLDDALAALEKK